MNLDVLDMNNWLTSTIQIVREKSLDAFEFIKKDLTDFTIIVKTDTENYIKKLQNQPIKLNHTINLNEKSSITLETFDRLQTERIRLENDESTYLIDPIPIENYKTWIEKTNFNIENFKNEITQLLINAPHIRLIYSRLVPTCTTHSDFWSRYYYYLYQLNEEETKRINLLKRAQEICNEKDEPDDDWEREFDENDLNTSKINQNRSDNINKTENEFDDEWESWS